MVIALNDEPVEVMLWPAPPSKVTVFELGVNVPPVLAQLPDIVKLPEGAVKVPLDKVNAPLTSAPPVEPVKIPPEMVKPPLRIWVAVEAK